MGTTCLGGEGGMGFECMCANDFTSLNPSTKLDRTFSVFVCLCVQDMLCFLMGLFSSSMERGGFHVCPSPHVASCGVPNRTSGPNCTKLSVFEIKVPIDKSGVLSYQGAFSG